MPFQQYDGGRECGMQLFGGRNQGLSPRAVKIGLSVIESGSRNSDLLDKWDKLNCIVPQGSFKFAVKPI